MGSISCDGEVVEFDDRVVAHLQVVIVQRFRSQEPVLLSWLDPLSEGDGRSSMWLPPTSVVHFKFMGSRSPAVDREWLDVLSRAAGSGAGLVVADEQGALVRATSHHLTGRRR